ncbi:probable E3 ubiquitin-protein ligase DTX2 isoform X2 [Xenopus tropicalis]|uniref:E3 ubiquitin-protein ligase n=1 Tax=Xenopus tropicalis TaxID=8364 RepID=A0A6I8PUU7_XENTR|nr:probable E3 ubiquitin-protein ligase DTX2 isoform X2 [Xenopus tropicalis]|eukprot:XP_017946644.1 PREDICTED: probable E3 ubiquitin-protein ligase DTX2 isoform X2 [Xenopus tropicalis]
MAAAPPPGGGVPSFSGLPTVSNQWNASVAVWEWQDEHNKWRPYSSAVSNYIEQYMVSYSQQKGFRAYGNSNSISLGKADPKLAPYIIDIPTLSQFRQDTGTMRSVRKSLYASDSAPAKGISWEWMNDEACWTAYEMPITIYLDENYCNRRPLVDLGAFGLPYQADLNSGIQINKMTGFRRQIQRRADIPYPLTSAMGPVHKSAACLCHQCLANSAAGPISGRHRHSMINLPTSSGSQLSRTSFASSFNVGYVPYPKPSMAISKSTPKLNSTWLISPVPLQFPGPSSSSNGTSIPSIPVNTQKQNSTKQALAGTATEPEKVVKKYLENVEKPPEEDCIICMETLNVASGYSDAVECKNIKPTAVGKLKKCGHTFHQLCVLAMYNNGNKDGSLQCPACKTIYGEKTGTQPKGNMEYSLIPQSLPGHQDCGTIHIVYTIHPGTQGPGHPNPGKPYSARGFPRHCYLPDNEKGRLVLELLKLAWARRLIFTIGVSSTTGESDTVVWNEIHHKTEMNSNISGHGYPDPNYMDNVVAELAAQGVTEDCLKM